MNKINKIVDIESYRNAVNKLEALAQDPTSNITINFPKSDNKDAKDFFSRFFGIADGNPEWYV